MGCANDHLEGTLVLREQQAEGLGFGRLHFAEVVLAEKVATLQYCEVDLKVVDQLAEGLPEHVEALAVADQ